MRGMNRRGLWTWAGAVSVLGLWASGALASPVGVSLKVNTLGAGADVTVNMGTYLNARAGFNYGQFNLLMSLDEADLDAKLRWQTVPVLLDYHPTGGGFRISLGGVVNNNRIDLSADPYEPLTLQGVDYTIDRLDGRIEFQRISPYFGIGVGNAVGGGRVHFACDFGVMYHGSPRVRAVAESNLPPALQAELDRDLQSEVDDLQDDLSGWRYYPVVSLGFSISF